MSPISLTEALADLPDPRSRHGQRFPLLPVLAVGTRGLLLGRQSLDAIARLGRLRPATAARPGIPPWQ